MNAAAMWLVLAVVVIGLTVLSQRQLFSGKIKSAYRELRILADQAKQGISSPADLSEWETQLAALERYPNEWNKLDQEIGLHRSFMLFLDRHYPDDPRLPGLRRAAGYVKDNVWGIKIPGREEPKERDTE